MQQYCLREFASWGRRVDSETAEKESQRLRGRKQKAAKRDTNAVNERKYEEKTETKGAPQEDKDPFHQSFPICPSRQILGILS